MKTQWIVLGCMPLLALGGALASCDASPEEEAPRPAETVVASQRYVQDLWVYERLTSVSATGEVRDLAAAIAEAFEGEPTATVELGHDVRFELYDGLGGRLTGEDGEAREDVHVTVGFIDAPEGRALAALATPTAEAEVPIGPGDDVRLDLAFLGELLEPGDPLFADFGFLQAIPFEGEPEPGSLSAPALLAARLQEGSLQYLGRLEEEGQPLVPMARANRYRRAIVQRFKDEVGEAARDAVVDDLHDKAVEGRLPAKAEDMTRGMAHGVKDCGGFGLKCVSDFFKSFGEGAKSSYEAALCNGDMGDCDPNPDPDPDRDPLQKDPPQRRPPPRNPPPRCLGGCGGSSGDPHLRTFDGKRYDLQAVGEFIAARTDGLDVQIRTAPWKLNQAVSINTGVAVGVGGQRITVLPHRYGEARIAIDGEELPLETLRGEGLEVGGGLLRFAGHLRLETADGHAVIIWAWPDFLDVTVDPADGDAPWEGLFGDRDGDSGNDFRLRDGEVLDPPLSHDDLYHRFAMDWRVTAEESLFDYAEGEGTQDHTDLDFPAEPMTSAELTEADRNRAEAICREAGVTDPDLLDACVLDWAMTGEMGMVRSAQVASFIESLGAPEPDPGTLPNYTWMQNASSLRGRDGEQFSFNCPPEGTPFPVWGTDLYTDDSSVCTAAVHAGRLTFAEGGEVTIEIRPIESSYQGSERNGVTSHDRGRFRGSFVFP